MTALHPDAAILSKSTTRSLFCLSTGAVGLDGQSILVTVATHMPRKSRLRNVCPASGTHMKKAAQRSIYFFIICRIDRGEGRENQTCIQNTKAEVLVQVPRQ